jgi:hypothetical protein
MSAQEPFEMTVGARRGRLADVAPALVGGTVVALGAAAVLLVLAGALRDPAGVMVVAMLAAVVGGALVAVAARVLGRPLGAAEDLSLGIHPGWYRYAPGRSGAVGGLAIVGFMVTVALRAPWLSPVMLASLVLGAAAAPVVFLVQRKRSAHAVPPSIR